jgi:hypothetical protein
MRSPVPTSMVVAWMMTRELGAGKAFAGNAARIPSMMERNDQIVLIPSTCSAGTAYNP